MNRASGSLLLRKDINSVIVQVYLIYLPQKRLTPWIPILNGVIIGAIQRLRGFLGWLVTETRLVIVWHLENFFLFLMQASSSCHTMHSVSLFGIIGRIRFTCLLPLSRIKPANSTLRSLASWRKQEHNRVVRTLPPASSLFRVRLSSEWLP